MPDSFKFRIVIEVDVDKPQFGEAQTAALEILNGIRNSIQGARVMNTKMASMRAKRKPHEFSDKEE